MEDREETSESLETEDEIPMCESALDDGEDLDSADGDSISPEDGDKTDAVPVSPRLASPRVQASLLPRSFSYSCFFVSPSAESLF